jgi:hypothetical protein
VGGSTAVRAVLRKTSHSVVRDRCRHAMGRAGAGLGVRYGGPSLLGSRRRRALRLAKSHRQLQAPKRATPRIPAKGLVAPTTDDHNLLPGVAAFVRYSRHSRKQSTVPGARPGTRKKGRQCRSNALRVVATIDCRHGDPRFRLVPSVPRARAGRMGPDTPGRKCPGG